MGNNRRVTGGPLRADHSISVVVAARDAASTIADAVGSALSSRLVVQCIVVDDASRDETRAIVERMSETDDRVQIVPRPDRGGPARARNDGLARARGDRVCFLDADDTLVAGGLEILAASMDQHPGAVAVLGRFQPVDTDGQRADVGRWEDDQLLGVVRRHGRMVRDPCGLTPEALVTRLVSPPPGAWLVDAWTACAVGGFDPQARRSEDLELLVRLAREGGVVAVDAVVLRYLRHGSQRSASVSRRQWGRGLTLWLMMRAAPGPRATCSLTRGMVANHLEMAARRTRSGDRSVQALGARNLVAAASLGCLGLVASILPSRTLRPVVPSRGE
jgi:glycosyltransferase involved in cell wall biosynthesis